MNLTIEIDRDNKQFVILGDLGLLLKNRQCKFYLFNTLAAKLNDNRVVIDYKEESSVELFLNKIRDSFSKYGVAFQDSSQIKNVLDEYYTEENNFIEFSQKALDIWENKLDKNEFDLFCNLLKKVFPNRTLYDKQLLSAYHLAFSQNACNFSVPGAGKTSIVYGAYAYLKSLPKDNPKHVNKIFIVGPLSSFGPWEDEYYSCFNIKPNSKRLSGGVSKTEKEEYFLTLKDSNNTPELTLISYQSVASESKNIINYLKKHDNRVMLVLDEAHKIKNTDGGLWANAILSLSKYCSSRVVLTGTPVPNGYEDLYNIFKFIWPNKKIIKFHLQQLKEMSQKRFDSRVHNLIDNIKPFFIRIRKSDLNLTKPIEHKPIIVEMGPIQKRIYEYIENQYLPKENIDDNTIKSILTKARLIRIMQTATNPSLLKMPIENMLLDGEKSSEIVIDDIEILNFIKNYSELEVPEKYKETLRLVNEIIKRGEKVIIWTTFIYIAKSLQNFLLNNHIDSKLLIGEIPVENELLDKEIETREGIIREFHNINSEFKVIIANPFSVAESISLHKACNNAIYLEKTFNATHFLQSKDRIHRVGMNKGVIVNYYYILTKDSIDESIHSRLLEKENIMLSIIESQEIPLISNNVDFELDEENDIKQIIRDYVKRSSKI